MGDRGKTRGTKIETERERKTKKERVSDEERMTSEKRRLVMGKTFRLFLCVRHISTVL